MRAALSGLTTRGRCLLAAGIAAALCSFVLGQRDLMRVAVLLLALPLVAVAVVARTRFRLSCNRHVVPDAVAVGQSATVEVELHNVSMLPTSPLLLEDDLPYALGGRPRFTVDRMPAGQKSMVRYAVRSDLRGRYRIGPLRLRLADPFGLVELTRSFSAVDVLSVRPVVVPLPAVQVGGAWTTGNGSTSRSVASRGEDDAATREYRHGDDLRKVHWRSTARVGKLMVRREERPWQARATVLLDTRGVAHRGEAPASSFEWLVSAAASIGHHLTRRGFELDFLTDDSHRGTEQRMTVDEWALMEYLTDVATSHNRDLELAANALRSAEQDTTLIALLGATRPEDARMLAGSRVAAASSIAVLLDSSSWLAGASEREQSALEASAAEFTHAGWRVVRASRVQSVAQVWAQAGFANDTLGVRGVLT